MDGTDAKDVAKWGGGRTVPVTERAKSAWDYACKETNREKPFGVGQMGQTEMCGIVKQLNNTDEKFIFY